MCFMSLGLKFESNKLNKALTFEYRYHVHIFHKKLHFYLGNYLGHKLLLPFVAGRRRGGILSPVRVAGVLFI